MTGIARALVDLLAALVGHRRGGLSYVLIAAMYLISGISGSKAADQAAVAPVLLPEMRRRGTPPGELAAQLAASAAMSETIPPSLVLIIVGAVTGVSTAALFTGGLLPAGIAAMGLALLVRVRSRGETAERGARDLGGDGPVVRDRGAGADPALRDPLRRAGRHRDRDRGRDGGRGVCERGRPAGVSLLRLAAASLPILVETAALVRRDPVHHRQRERHELGADAGRASRRRWPT